MMTTKTILLFVMFGLALVATGCDVNPRNVAVHSANVAAGTLAAAHETMAPSYLQAQLDAAAVVEGEPGAPETKAAQREAVRHVRVHWLPAWRAYSSARAAWLSAVASIRVADQLSRPPPDGWFGVLMETQRTLGELLRAIANAGLPVPAQLSLLTDAPPTGAQ